MSETPSACGTSLSYQQLPVSRSRICSNRETVDGDIRMLSTLNCAA